MLLCKINSFVKNNNKIKLIMDRVLHFLQNTDVIYHRVGGVTVAGTLSRVTWGSVPI